ncbi:MAG TPA: hypothetical protein VLU46_15115, partial [Thermoanaerobaculia bacterium]|nr:hypothetical protein [Thermoanaerobaculia bacterium]
VDHLSVKHPGVIEHYRAGHAVIDAPATASTEDLRQAMLHYRALFEDLVKESADIPREVRSDREIVEPAPVIRSVRDEDRPRN